MTGVSLIEGYCHVGCDTVQPEEGELVACFAYSTMKMDAVRSSETSLNLPDYKASHIRIQSLLWEPKIEHIIALVNIQQLYHNSPSFKRYLSVAGKKASADLASELSMSQRWNSSTMDPESQVIHKNFTDAITEYPGSKTSVSASWGCQELK
jgi:hypothetical protein